MDAVFLGATRPHFPTSPAGHSSGLTAPRGQYDPAGQGPVHVSFSRSVEAPKRPGAHGTAAAEPATQKEPAGQLAVQGAVLPALLPNFPAAHSSQTEAPERLNRPAGHTVTVGVCDPAGHAYPAEHGPVQFSDATPATAP